MKYIGLVLLLQLLVSEGTSQFSTVLHKGKMSKIGGERRVDPEIIIAKKNFMKYDIKILGSGCTKCKITYNNVLEAVKETGVEATVTKIEDIAEMMKYNVLTTPVLMINDQFKVQGRVADVKEIKDFLIQSK